MCEFLIHFQKIYAIIETANTYKCVFTKGEKYEKEINKFYFAFCLIIPAIFCLSACTTEYDPTDPPQHSHEWATTWDYSSSNHWINCPDCYEKINVEQHDMEFVEYDELRREVLYRCSICSYEEKELYHYHSLGEIISSNETAHLANCSVCGEEFEEAHRFGDRDVGKLNNYTVDGFKVIFECLDCEHKVEVNLFEIEGVEGGSIEYLYSDEESFVAKPVAEDGYYFDKWNVEFTTYAYNGTTTNLFRETTSHTNVYNSPIEEFETGLVNSSRFTITTITPIFTTEEPDFEEFEIILKVENNLEVEYEYMYYLDSDGVTRASIFIPENDNVVITETMNIYPGNVVSNEEIRPLPYLITSAGGDAFGVCEAYKIIFEDMRNKGLISVYYQIDDSIIGGDDYNKTPYRYLISDNSGKNNIEIGCVRDYNNVSSYFFVDKWIDLSGNVISNNKSFTSYINYDKTLIAVMKLADVVYDANDGEGSNYIFSKNADNTLTFEGVYNLNSVDNVVIPNNVNGLMVTGIGDNAFLPVSYGKAVGRYSIIVPETVVNFGENAFVNTERADITILGDKTNLEFSMFRNEELLAGYLDYNIVNDITINITKKTLQNMVQNLVHTFVDIDVDIVFADSTHLGTNVLGHYEGASKKICILESENYSFATFAVIVHELRHFYQEIAIGNVEGLTVDDLLIQPTQDEIGAWKYLEYISSTEDYEAYWYNAREIDARNYAEEILGVNIFER